MCRQDRRIVEPGSALPYLSLEHVEAQTGRILKEPAAPVDDEGKSATFAFDTRHVLYGKLRPYLNKVALPDFAGRCTTEMIPLLPTGQILREFLCWVLRRPEVVEAAMRGKTGSRMPRADMNALMELEIPRPPLAEQERLVRVLRERLGAVARARRATEEQLTAARALPAAYLRAVFNSPEAQDWPKKRLGEHVTKVGSGITPLGGHTAYVRSGIPLIRSQNVHMNRFDPEGLVFITLEQDEQMANSRVQPGDVLLNITGASIGRVCVVPDQLCPANVNQHVSVIRGNGSFDPAFLALFISTLDFQKFILSTQAGATRQALTITLIQDFEIPLPPLAVQRRIAAELSARLAGVERLRRALEEQWAAIEALPAALLRQAFRGEL